MPGQVSLYRNGDNGGERPDRRRVVLLDPHQPPQNILLVTGPPVDVCVLEPAGDVTLVITQSRGQQPEGSFLKD